MPILLQSSLIAIAFLALIGVILEEKIHINKAKITLFLGATAWMILFIHAGTSPQAEQIKEGFAENLAEISTLWLFLMAAMTFVAYLNKKGVIESLIYIALPKALGERSLMFLIGTFCFFFSSLADNITATLVSMALILSLKLPAHKALRYAVMAVFAVNSGGVALITGDVTTLMIFLADRVAIGDLLLLIPPAYFAVLVLGLLLSRPLTGRVVLSGAPAPIRPVDKAIGLLLLATILTTIILNALLGVPPVLTFLLGLSVMFLVARFFDEDDEHEPVIETIRLVEFEALLFFLGILLLVGMLKEIGALSELGTVYNLLPTTAANYLVGLMSALVDNVPLTAAILKAGLDVPTSDWLALTYAVGVGGANLVIGSAAGIVAMSKLPEMTFMAYLRFLPALAASYTVGYAGTVWLARSLT